MDNVLSEDNSCAFKSFVKNRSFKKYIEHHILPIHLIYQVKCITELKLI